MSQVRHEIAVMVAIALILIIGFLGVSKYFEASAQMEIEYLQKEKKTLLQ